MVSLLCAVAMETVCGMRLYCAEKSSPFIQEAPKTRMSRGRNVPLLSSNLKQICFFCWSYLQSQISNILAFHLISTWTLKCVGGGQ